MNRNDNYKDEDFTKDKVEIADGVWLPVDVAYDLGFKVCTDGTPLDAVYIID